jgi:hypothetical protein
VEPETGINDIPVEEAAPGKSPVGPTVAPEVYRRLGPERTARGDFFRFFFDRACIPVFRYLKRLKAGSRRIASTLKHEQDPAKAERAGRVLSNLPEKVPARRERAG